MNLDTFPKSGRLKKQLPPQTRLLNAFLPFKSSPQIKVKILNTNICFTVQRRLVEDQLYSSRPPKTPWIFTRNGTVRLSFTWRHINWTVAGWRKVLFQQDNDPKRTSNHVQAWFRQFYVIILDWPVHSTAFNPTGNWWKKVELFPNKHGLMNKITEVWRNIPLWVLEKFINSMPRNCAKVVTNNGYCMVYRILNSLLTTLNVVYSCYFILLRFVYFINWFY